jgi:hypothetical protein
MSTDSAGLHADRREGEPAWRNLAANQAFDGFKPHTKVVSEMRRGFGCFAARVGFPEDLIIRVQCMFAASIFDGYVIFAAVGSLPVCVCLCPTG